MTEGRKIRIKQVPDAGPNEAGVWVERVLPPDKGRKENALRLWDDLTALCDPGHHAVKFEFPEDGVPVGSRVYRRRSIAGGKVFEKDKTNEDRMSENYLLASTERNVSMAIATGSRDFIGPEHGNRRFTVFGQEVWKHTRSGGRYEVIAHGRMEDTLLAVVVYRSLKDHKVWVRPSDEFYEKFERVS